MSKLFRVPSTIAEYTVGTMIVLVQATLLRPLAERSQRLKRWR